MPVNIINIDKEQGTKAALKLIPVERQSVIDTFQITDFDRIHFVIFC